MKHFAYRGRSRQLDRSCFSNMTCCLQAATADCLRQTDCGKIYDDIYISLLQKLSLTDELYKLQAIHVAGTKGKGSTCAMVDSILRKCGYRTGLFTSPHLIDVRERIRING